MVRMGKAYDNLLVDLRTGSEQARDRARRIVMTVTGLDCEDAETRLRQARWNVQAAIVMQMTGQACTGAPARLREAYGSVRAASGEDTEPHPSRHPGAR